MQKLVTTTLFLALSLIVFAQLKSLRERLDLVPTTTIYPYYGAKILAKDQEQFTARVGFNPGDYGKLPIYTWDNVQATLYTLDGDNEGAALYRKFIPQNKNYIVAPIMIGNSDWQRALLLTFTNTGQVIDYLEVFYGFHGYGMMSYKQWKIENNMKVTVYHLKSTVAESIPLESQFTQLNLQRVDTEYQIDSTGHFVKLSEKKYQPKDYMCAYLEDNTKNIWQGNEVLIP